MKNYYFLFHLTKNYHILKTWLIKKLKMILTLKILLEICSLYNYKFIVLIKINNIIKKENNKYSKIISLRFLYT